MNKTFSQKEATFITKGNFIHDRVLQVYFVLKSLYYIRIYNDLYVCPKVDNITPKIKWVD